MRLPRLFHGLLAAGLSRAEALPATTAADEPVACASVDTFTVEWFLANALPRFSRPFHNTALFYSRGMSTPAMALARRSGLTTIWDVWPCHLYVHRDEPGNPMRCIHNDAANRTRFYEAMSQAFAMKAQGYATVMHGSDDYESPPTDGIWGRVEFPTLRTLGHVQEMAKIDGVVSRFKVFWKFGLDLSSITTKDVKKWPAQWLALAKQQLLKMELKKRDLDSQTFGGACMMPSEYAFFDNVNW